MKSHKILNLLVVIALAFTFCWQAGAPVTFAQAASSHTQPGTPPQAQMSAAPSKGPVPTPTPPRNPPHDPHQNIPDAEMDLETESLAPSPSAVASADLATAAPDQPSLVSPPNGASGVSTTPVLKVNVTDPDSSVLDVTFYGRVAQSGSQSSLGPNFTIIVLPDTQNYTTSSSRAQIFNSQTQWIASNQAIQNIVYVAHLGDMVNDADKVESEWQVGDKAMSFLETATTTEFPNGIPYGVAIGNNDTSTVGVATLYNKYFGKSRFSGRSYYGGSYPGANNNNNHYSLFSASGMDFITIYLEYDSSPETAILNWADNLLKTYSNRRAIVVTHHVIGSGNPGAFSTLGLAIYNALKGNANLFLMLGGHISNEGQRQDTYNGNTVYSLLSDYQNRTNGGNGWLRIMEFQPANNQIQVKTYSPYLNQYEIDANSQFTLSYPMSSSGFMNLGTKSGVPSGSEVSLTWPGLASQSQYEWYVTISDRSQVTTGPTWSFTTGTNQKPTDISLSPNTIDERLPAGTAVGTLTATDPNPGDLFTYSLVSGVGDYASFSIQGKTLLANTSFDYETKNSYSIRVRATDGGGLCLDKDFTIGVNDVDENQLGYTLTVNIEGSGTVTKSPDQASYQSGEPVTLTASPVAGWNFGGWGGDLAGSTNPAVITMDGNKTITATFTSSPSAEVKHEETRTGGSTGSATVSTSTNLTGVSGNLYLAAISSRSLAVVKSVTGLGLIWTKVKAQCAGRNQTGMEVWMAQGDSSGNGMVTASFVKAPSYAAIAVSRYSGIASINPIGNLVSGNTNGASGACNGGVDSASYSFNLTTTANGSVVYGAVTMRGKTHTPGAGYTEQAEFIQAANASVAVEDRTVAPPATVVVNGAFSGAIDWAAIALEIKPGDTPPPQYTLSINITGSGMVTKSPDKATYQTGEQVTLTASPDAGWSFSSWSGELGGSNNPVTITMDSSKTITATFIQQPPDEYTLAVNITGSGTVSKNPDKAAYQTGEQVTLTASPDAGWSFSGWSGDLNGSTNPATLAIDSNKSVTATFVQIPANQYSLTVNTAGQGSVTLDPPGGVYDSGTSVQLTAAAASGWSFSGWSGDLSGAANPAILTMDGNKIITATFTSSPPAEVKHEETRTGGSSSSMTVTTSTGLTGVSGNLYLAAIASRSMVPVSSVSGLGLTWIKVRAQCAGRNQTGMEVWMAQGSPTVSGVVTATFAGAPSYVAIAVSRYSGVSATNPIGNVISGNTNGASGACSGGLDSASYSFNLTTTVSGSVVYGAATMRGKIHAPGAGYTERAEYNQAGYASIAVEDQTIASPSPGAVNGTFSSAVDWAMIALEILPGGAP